MSENTDIGRIIEFESFEIGAPEIIKSISGVISVVKKLKPVKAKIIP